MATIDRDRNLLFGILAAQLKGVRPERIIEVGAAWATDPSRSLAERMVALGILSETDRKFLEALVEGAVQAHGGDSRLALETLGGEAQIEQTFSGTLRLAPGGHVETVEMDLRPAAPSGALELNIPEETPGRYSRISVYGRGGMGRVLLVHDENMDRDVAMKELLPHPPDVREPWTPVGHTAAMVARFLREARLTGLLEHPSIVPVYELGRRSDGSLYYTMKLVRGKTFLQAIRDGKGLAQRLTLLPHFLNLCHAIAYAHSRGVIHRDLKPANVMVGDFGETVVLDWGIAKAQGAQDLHETEIAEAITALRLDEQEFTFQTETGEALGTPHYMPPEQAQGRINDIDKRSDVYSLGAVLYEMLTAKTPHSGRTTKEIIEHVVREPVRPVIELEQDAPPELAVICDKCLNKDPAHRYQSARELADEIERFLSGALVRSYKYNLGQLLRYYYRRHRAVLNTAMAGAAALLLLAVYSYVSITRAYHREQEQRQIAEVARDEAVEAKDKEAEAKEAAVVAKDEEEKAREAAERQLYISSILLARQSIDDRRYDVAIEALERAPAAHRNWEWGYYNRLCHLDEHTLAGHEGPVTYAEYSPDGKLIVTASDDHTAKVWDAQTGALLFTLAGHTDELRSAKFSPDGTRVATCSDDGTARIWDCKTGQQVFLLAGHEKPLWTAEFNPNGTRLVTASDDALAKIWDLSDGRELQTLRGHEKYVIGAYFVRGGSQVVTASWDTSVRVWDAATGAEYAATRAAAEIRNATCDASGARVLYCSRDEAWLWDMEPASQPVLLFSAPRLTRLDKNPGVQKWRSFSSFNAQSTAFLLIHDSTLQLFSEDTAVQKFETQYPRTLSSAAFSPDGSTVATASVDKSAVLIDANTGSQLAVLLGHSDHVRSVRFHPDGTRVLTASLDGSAKIWNVDETPTDYPKRITGHSKGIVAMQLSADRERLLTASNDMTAKVWNLSSGLCLLTLGGEAVPVRSAMFTSDESGILTSLFDHALILWDATTGAVLHRFEGHTDVVNSAAISLDGQWLITGSTDGTAILWDLRQAVMTRHFVHGANVVMVRFSPMGDKVITASHDTRAKIWDTTTAELLVSLSGHTRGVVSASFSADGTFVVTTSEDATIRLWNAATGEGLRTFRGHQDRVAGATFLSAGEHILSWSNDGTARLWDTKTGAQLRSFRGGDNLLSTAVISPDNLRILTASGTGGVKWWDLDTGTELAALVPEGSNCFGALIAPDGKTIISASDSTIHLWNGEN